MFVYSWMIGFGLGMIAMMRDMYIMEYGVYVA